MREVGWGWAWCERGGLGVVVVVGVKRAWGGQGQWCYGVVVVGRGYVRGVHSVDIQKR
jgi:hypothetical protein